MKAEGEENAGEASTLFVMVLCTELQMQCCLLCVLLKFSLSESVGIFLKLRQNSHNLKFTVLKVCNSVGF